MGHLNFCPETDPRGKNNVIVYAELFSLAGNFVFLITVHLNLFFGIESRDLSMSKNNCTNWKIFQDWYFLFSYHGTFELFASRTRRQILEVVWRRWTISCADCTVSRVSPGSRLCPASRCSSHQLTLGMFELSLLKQSHCNLSRARI